MTGIGTEAPALAVELPSGRKRALTSECLLQMLGLLVQYVEKTIAKCQIYFNLLQISVFQFCVCKFKALKSH